MNIAMLAPGPSDKSGISEYTYDLCNNLSNYSFIDYFTNRNICNVTGNFKYYNIRDINYKKYDSIICHMGNNINYHSWIYEFLKKKECIVQIHDIVLHHFIYEYCRLNQNNSLIQDYRTILTKWYGLELTEEIMSKKKDQFSSFLYSDKIINFPLFEEVLQYSSKIIVHSKYSYNKIKKIFPNKNVFYFKQLYNLSKNKKKKQNKKLRIGLFGTFSKYKCTTDVLNALKSYRKIEICLCGDINNEIKEQIKKLEIKVISTGFTSTKIFNENISNCELIINLRNPTMGETSAVASKALQYGTPLIVSDCGWYKELPQFILKVNNNNLINDLKIKLNYFINNHVKIKQESLNYSVLYNKHNITDYLSFISK